ncbi:MAG: hypothetical protein KF799_13175, partial [Bdellovibrionales bacterium]|nr:hypothetical protein [Bdellovibrionales bacterium]
TGMNLPLRVQNLNTTNGASTGIGFKVATTSGDQHFKSGIVFQRIAAGGLGSLHFLLSTDTGSTNVDLNDSRMLLTRGGQLAIGAGTTSSSNAGLDVATTGTALSSIIIPRDSTTNRPLTPVNGMIRYNTTDAKFEFYQNGAWVNYGTGSGGGSVTWPLAANPAVTSASAPSFSFTGDTNTGLYSPSAGQINLTTDGTARLAVTSQGYVGVGTTNPLQTLHITDNASGIQLGTPGTGAFDNVGISILTAKGDNHLLGWNGGEKGWQMSARGDANTVNTVEQNDLQFTYYEAGTWTSTLFLDHLGKIGIGTNSPAVGLDIATTGTAGSGIVIPRDSTANRPPGVNGMIRYNTSDAKFEFYQNGAWVNYGTGSGGGASFPLLASPGTTPPSAPSYSFTGATSTGLYSPAAGRVTVATVGTARLTIGETGNVGIGTGSSNPTSKLQIEASNEDARLSITNWNASSWGQSASIVLNTYNLTAGQKSSSLTMNNFSGDSGTPGSVTTGNWLGAIEMSGYGGATQSIAGRVYALAEGTFSASSAPSALRFQTTSLNSTTAVDRVTINNQGHVGIGTTSPAALLDIATNGTVGSAIIVPRDSTANRPMTAVNGMIRYNSGDNKFEFYQNGAWVNYGTGSGGGSVTWPLAASPAVTSAGAPSYSFTSDTNTGMYTSAADTLGLSTAGTARLTILPDGKLGIGTTSPTDVLDIYGSTATDMGIRIRNKTSVAGASAGIYYQGENQDYTMGWMGYNSALTSAPYGGRMVLEATANNGGGLTLMSSAASADMRFIVGGNTAGAEKVRITSAGKVGIGASSPTAHLEVAGQIVSKESVVASGNTADFANGNSIIMQSLSGTAITVSNMVAGGIYNIVIEDTTSRTYTFTGCTTSYFQPTNGATSYRTVYTIYRRGSNTCYISWITGFN